MIARTTRPLTEKERAMLAPKGTSPAAQAFLFGKLDMTCEGEYLSPICVNPPFTVKNHKSGVAPEDGEILETEFGRLKKR